MKWKAKKEPKEGDTRIRRKFAWIPVYTYCETELYTVWLETYLAVEEYKRVLVNKGGYYSSVLKWKLIERRPLFGEYE